MRCHKKEQGEHSLAFSRGLDHMGCLLIVPLTGVVLALGVGLGAIAALLMGLAASWVTSLASFIAFLLIMI